MSTTYWQPSYLSRHPLPPFLLTERTSVTSELSSDTRLDFVVVVVVAVVVLVVVIELNAMRFLAAVSMLSINLSRIFVSHQYLTLSSLAVLRPLLSVPRSQLSAFCSSLAASCFSLAAFRFRVITYVR